MPKSKHNRNPWRVVIGNGPLLHKWVGSDHTMNGEDARVAIACRNDWIPTRKVTIILVPAKSRRRCARCVAVNGTPAKT